MLESRLGGSGPCDEAWAQAVSGTLDALLELLGVHFAREEAALPPERASKVFPKLASSIARLNAQHAELVARVGAARRAVGVEQAALDAAAVQAQIAGIIADMRAHEREETELFADVDLGGS